MRKTTEKHFEYFQERFRYWCDYLGVKGWSIYFEHKSYDNAYATMLINYSGRAATVGLNTEWPEPRLLNQQTLDRSALHEALHLLIAPVEDLACLRYITESSLDIAVEELVNSLTSALIEPVKIRGDK